MVTPSRCLCGALPVLTEKRRLGANATLTFFRLACDECSNGLETRKGSAKTAALDLLVERWNATVERAREKNPLGVHLIEGGKRCICSRCELLYRGYDVGRAEIAKLVAVENARRYSEDLNQVDDLIREKVGP